MKKNAEKNIKNEENEVIKDNHEGLIHNIILVAAFIALIYILFLTGVVKVTPHNSSNTINSESEEIGEAEEKEKLDVTDPTVTTLYKNVELGRNYNALRHYYFYSYDKLFVKYMDEAFIKEMALSKLTLADDATSVDANILENQYKNIVGNNTTFKNRTFQTQCATVKYATNSNTYTINNSTGCEKSVDTSEGYFDKIVSAYKYSDRIEIITRVGYYEEEKELVSEGVYQTTGNIKVKKNMDTDEVVNTFTESLEQMKKAVDYNKLTKYKYTYRLDNTKYYFYSVEVIE